MTIGNAMKQYFSPCIHFRTKQAPRQAILLGKAGFLKSCLFIQNGAQARRSEEEGVAVGAAHSHTFLFP